MRILFGSIVVVAALAAHSQAPAGDAARGKTLFMQDMCYTCHGTAGQGGDRGSGPRIAPNVFPLEGFVKQVRHPREQMPRYSEKFVSDADLADIHAYLASQAAPTKGLPALLR